MKKRILSLFLCLLVILPLAAACGDVNDPSGNSTSAPVGTASPEVTTESPYDENGYLRDAIPADTDLGGITLSMLYWDDASADEFFVNETNGEAVNDAIYDRNIRVEERLKVGFDYIGTAGNNSNREAFLKYAQNAASGGTNFDLYASYSMSTALLAYNGLCRNLLNYPVIDLEKPWWPKSITTEATIRNKLYFISGDISTNLIYTMYGVFFNVDLQNEYNLESPYQCVKDNTWTFDKMFEMSSAFETSSVGGDVIYGFTAASNVYLDPFFFAAGLRTVDSDAEGNLKIADSFHSETTEDVAGKVWDFLHQPYSNFTDSKNEFFVTGSSLFVMTTCLFAKTKLQNIGFKYGIVPTPKYSADQAEYTTLNGFTYSLYAISSTSEQPEAAAVALECLGSEGYRIITPALFEITMKARYAENKDAADMFELIRGGVTFDVGRIFTSSLEKLTYNIFRNNISDATKASYLTSFNSKKKILDMNLEKLNDVFSDVG